MTDASVTITRDGETFGPFDVRGVRATPGLYQTRHIFTAVGEYQSVLSFRKGEATEVHTVDFVFRIGDRAELEILAQGLLEYETLSGDEIPRRFDPNVDTRIWFTLELPLAPRL